MGSKKSVCKGDLKRWASCAIAASRLKRWNQLSGERYNQAFSTFSICESMDVDPKDIERIAAEIHSDTSPVGIDAKKTHILILQKLEDIQARLAKVESQVHKIWISQ